MKHISVEDLAAGLNAGIEFHLIDVREPHEHAAFNIGGKLIPLNTVLAKREEIPIDIPVILYCRIGVRSQIAIQRLEGKFPFENLFNLAGGIEAWKKYFHSDHSAF